MGKRTYGFICLLTYNPITREAVTVDYIYICKEDKPLAIDERNGNTTADPGRFLVILFESCAQVKPLQFLFQGLPTNDGLPNRLKK